MNYWDNRYLRGGDSGAGSRGRLARFKADTVSRIARDHGVSCIADYGCGDGFVASLLDIDCDYVGYDPSLEALRLAAKRVNYRLVNDPEITGDMAISLDVVLHLVDDEDFEEHMRCLFRHPLVVIYGPSTNVQPTPCAPHVRFRDFCAWTDRPALKMLNPYSFRGDYQTESFSDFYVFSEEYNNERRLAVRHAH